jgi:hypothetical protein
MPAMFGWFWYGKILGRKILPKGPIDTYNKMVPIFKIADKIVFNLYLKKKDSRFVSPKQGC